MVDKVSHLGFLMPSALSRAVGDGGVSAADWSHSRRRALQFCVCGVWAELCNKGRGMSVDSRGSVTRGSCIKVETKSIRGAARGGAGHGAVDPCKWCRTLAMSAGWRRGEERQGVGHQEMVLGSSVVPGLGDSVTWTL
jgi:hypothetical protein